MATSSFLNNKTLERLGLEKGSFAWHHRWTEDGGVVGFSVHSIMFVVFSFPFHLHPYLRSPSPSRLIDSGFAFSLVRLPQEPSPFCLLPLSYLPFGGLSDVMSAAAETHIRVAYKGQHYLIPTDFVTKEHPGGKKLILRYQNGDITEAFEDAGHSGDALEMLEEWMENAPAALKDQLNERAAKRREEENEWRWRSTAIAFTVATIVAAYVFRKK